MKSSIFDKAKYFMKDKRAQLLRLHNPNIPLIQLLFPYFIPQNKGINNLDIFNHTCRKGSISLRPT